MNVEIKICNYIFYFMAEISFHSLQTSQQGRFAEVNSQLNFRQMIEKIKKIHPSPLPMGFGNV